MNPSETEDGGLLVNAVPPIEHRPCGAISDVYSKGRKIQIRSYVPPKCCDTNYWFSKEEFARRQTSSLAEMSRDFLPREGGMLGRPVELEITSPIRTGPSFNSQVVKVKVPSVSRLENRIAAKIYDPFGTGKFIDPEINPFKLADQMFTTEAAAYERLAPLYGTIVPKYLGSYTFDAPTGLTTDTRAVRLILYEFVEGVVMRDIGVEATQLLPQEVRKKIMYKVVEAESRIWASNVRHGDPHPRNSILELDTQYDPAIVSESTGITSQLADSDIRVRYFDFDKAEIDEFSEDLSRRLPGQSDKPVSPILRWHPDLDYVDSFINHGWVDWDWLEWLEQCWGDDDFYAPITLEAEKAWTLPSWDRVFARQRHRVVSVQDLAQQDEPGNISESGFPPRDSQVDGENTSSPVTTADSDTGSEKQDSRKKTFSEMRV